MKPLRVKPEDVEHLYQMPCSIPRWLGKYEVLIRTRRRNRYYIVEGIALGATWIVNGFSKFKVKGYKDGEDKVQLHVSQNTKYGSFSSLL